MDGLVARGVLLDEGLHRMFIWRRGTQPLHFAICVFAFYFDTTTTTILPGLGTTHTTNTHTHNFT